jgi:hypothetical protein
LKELEKEMPRKHHKSGKQSSTDRLTGLLIKPDRFGAASFSSSSSSLDSERGGKKCAFIWQLGGELPLLAMPSRYI